MKSPMLVSVLAIALLQAPALAFVNPAHGAKSVERRSHHAGALVHPDLTFQVLFKKGDEYLGAPTVIGQFGREVRIEIPNAMRVVVMAERPDQDGRSFTSARMSIFKDKAWQFRKEMTMRATLTATPSFQYSVDGTPYRFEVMPRLIVPAAS